MACCSKLLRPLVTHPMNLAVSLDLSKQCACSHRLPSLLKPFRVSGQPPDASQTPRLSGFQLGHWMHCLARRRWTNAASKVYRDVTTHGVGGRSRSRHIVFLVHDIKMGHPAYGAS